MLQGLGLLGRCPTSLDAAAITRLLHSDGFQTHRYI
jgi:hypothetical protein